MNARQQSDPKKEDKLNMTLVENWVGAASNNPNNSIDRQSTLFDTKLKILEVWFENKFHLKSLGSIQKTSKIGKRPLYLPPPEDRFS